MTLSAFKGDPGLVKLLSSYFILEYYLLIVCSIFASYFIPV